jgi:adenine-specific DNA-methyltransferase
MNRKKNRGQFFTTYDKVLQTLVSLIENDGQILEPSAGRGHIIKKIESTLQKEVVGVELDNIEISNKVCDSEIQNINFFEYIKTNTRYSTVIGNPPFVKLKFVEKETSELLPEKIPANGNLYYYFIKYSVELLNKNGELIFIVPKEWLYNVSSKFVRDYLQNNGGFTHFIDCGEEKLFEDADVPALCIFRFEKNYKGGVKFFECLDDFDSNIYKEKTVMFNETISFQTGKQYKYKLKDFFSVKVGLVTGKEKVFKKPESLILEESCSKKILTTKKIFEKYVFVEQYDNFTDIPELTQTYLKLHEKTLKLRKIKNFDDTNWWKYGAMRNYDLMLSPTPRIYGLMKSRDKEKFWLGEEKTIFGGGVMGLFPKKDKKIDLNKVVEFLNSTEFDDIMKNANMYSGNKLSITPSVLESLSVPNFEISQ